MRLPLTSSSWAFLGSITLVFGMGGCSSDQSAPAADAGADGSGPAVIGEGEGEDVPDPAFRPGEGEGEDAPTPDPAGEGEGELPGEGEGEPDPPDDGTCPGPPKQGEPRWCLDVVPRFNTSERRDLDGDGEDDFFGLREYLIDRGAIVSQDPSSPVSLLREGFPFQCRYGLLVPHGGGIEGGTEQLARAVLQRLPEPASDAVGAWVLGGRNSTRNLCSGCSDGPPCADDCHHVTSTAINPDCAPLPGEDPDDPNRIRARLPRILDQCPTGLSLHGHARPEIAGKEMIVVGGGDIGARTALADLLRRELAAGHFTSRLIVVDASEDAAADAGLGGTRSCNIANRWTPDRDSAGVQLELPPSLRPSGVRLDSPRATEQEHPLYFHRHEAQTLLGDPAVLADTLADFICSQLNPEAVSGCS